MQNRAVYIKFIKGWQHRKCYKYNIEIFKTWKFQAEKLKPFIHKIQPILSWFFMFVKLVRKFLFPKPALVFHEV